MNRILVWDLPTRAFHWLLALSFAGAFLTAESEQLPRHPRHARLHHARPDRLPPGCGAWSARATRASPPSPTGRGGGAATISSRCWPCVRSTTSATTRRAAGRSG
ncbi:MAG: cytochrome b/b6 domain-containing protein [Comamonadaceae bacterium]|nr:cytochrome b/b6 domain-containing protein [Comamonadaceae bacterium]